MATYDVVLKGGRVIDPAQGIDATLDIGTKHGRIAALEEDLSTDDAWLVLDVADHFVTPGLIDLHTHIYWGGTDLGVLPDASCLPSGVTTAVDAGSAGWANFPGFRHFVMGHARTRTFAFVNISSIGITDMRVGENLNLAYCGVEDAIKAIEAHRDVALGVKVRVAEKICGPNGLEPLRRAAEVRDATNTRMMVHISDCEQPVQEILGYLKAGRHHHPLLHGARKTDLGPAAGHRAAGRAGRAAKRHRFRRRPRTGELFLCSSAGGVGRWLPA